MNEERDPEEQQKRLDEVFYRIRIGLAGLLAIGIIFAVYAVLQHYGYPTK